MQEALNKFNEVINSSEDNNCFLNLYKEGWVEQESVKHSPIEVTWKFQHPDFPGVEILWNPLQEAQAIKV